MKAVRWNEVFASTMDNLDVDVEKTVSSNTDMLEQEAVKKAISDNPFLQKALLEEIVNLNCFAKSFDIVSMNNRFFTGEACNSGDLLVVLKMVYGMSIPLINEKHKVTGYQTSGTSQVALKVAREMYKAGEIDSLILHFLSLEEEAPQRIGEEKILKMEKTPTLSQENFNGSAGYFYRMLKDDLKQAGIYYFTVNRLNEEDLEKDFYIQMLLELGHSVYICKFKDTDFLNVYVK